MENLEEIFGILCYPCLKSNKEALVNETIRKMFETEFSEEEIKQVNFLCKKI